MARRKKRVSANLGGTWQNGIIASLKAGVCVTNPVSDLRGRAKNYAGNYRRSFQSALNKLRKAGYEITRSPGPRGGEYSAVYCARKTGGG